MMTIPRIPYISVLARAIGAVAILTGAVSHASAQNADYKICVGVPDLSDAGTDRNYLFLTLVGDGGTISEFLVDNDSGDQLNRGTVSCFKHKLKDIGFVSRIKVQHKSEDDMIVNGVSVVRSINGIQQSRNEFAIYNNTWIGKDTDSDGVWVNTSTPRPRTGPAEVSEFTLTGEWRVVQSCSGAKCKEISNQISSGVEQGKEVSKSSTIGESLSLMVGTEVKAGTGSLPGAEVTTKFELTGTMSQEQSTAVAKSFSSTKSKSITVTCIGQGTMWQWVSQINIIRVDGATDYVEALSILTKCANLGEKPKKLNDISWADPVADPS